MSLTVEGLDAAIRDFRFAANRVQPGAARVVVSQAERLAQRMKERVAVDEGTTRDSITSDDTAKETGDGVSAEAGPEWFVGKFLEEGTSKMAPRPFAEPALGEQLPEFERAISRLRDGLL